MFKTPLFGTLFAAAALAAAPAAFAAPEPTAEGGVRSFDGRGDTTPTSEYGFVAATPGGRADLDSGAAARTPGVDGALAADTGALPLAQFARGETRTPIAHSPTGLRALVERVRDGGLPEPASWALMLIGFGMIGGALRGFIVANRRLAGLQPEDTE
jgi:hypothetical protein